MLRAASLAALLLFFSSSLAQTPQTYTVVSGDTLTRIAARFDTTVETLQTLNALAGTNIRAGQVLRVGAREDALPEDFERYTVAAGDTLSDIASRFEVSEAALRAVNPAFYDAPIPPGATLRIPPAGGEVVVMGPGDTVLALALSHGLSPSTLMQVNGLYSLTDATEGRALYLVSADAPGLEPPTSKATPPTLEGRRESLLTQQKALLARAPVLLETFEPAVQGYAWPLSGARISSRFGPRNVSVLGNTFHTGLDLAAPPGTPVAAARDGVVTRAGPAGRVYGNAVFLDHGDGSSTRYAHLSQVLVAPGARVQQGDPIGRVGSTGASTGPHLHFELRFDGRVVDPLGYLP